MSLYDADFFEWTREQSAALRRRLAERANTDLDLENLAEEIESLGSRDRRAVESTITRIIEHLLKLEHSPAVWPRRGWQISVTKQRIRLRRLFRDSPGLRSGVDVGEPYSDARRLTEQGLTRDTGAEAAIPISCPYTLEQIADEDFWPERRAGGERG